MKIATTMAPLSLTSTLVLTFMAACFSLGIWPARGEPLENETPHRGSVSAPHVPLENHALPTDGPWPWIKKKVDQLDVDFLKFYAQWVIGAPALVVAILIFMMLRPRRTVQRHPRVAAALDFADRPQTMSKPAAVRTARPAVKLSDQQQVLRFFLQLFKTQSNAEADAPAQIVRTETRPTCPDETYEMRVFVKKDWVVRRMSIGLLGQGGGSRSRCFYVIYDTHMVIKIPAVPMVKFSEYKRQVATEGRIVERLAPRQCIVPRISVILKAVHSFPDSARLSEDQLETKYMRLVESQPQLQEQLKLGESFAFFMDLAKYFFLSNVLEEIHSGYSRLIDEASQHPELLWDQHAFVCRYGDEAGPVCHALQDAYYRCEARLRGLVEQAGAGQTITTYHLKQWFLAHMVGEVIRRDDVELPAETVPKINQLLDEVVQQNRPQVERYRQQLKEYIHQTRFSQYRHQVESLATNLLDLLAWIGQKGLALRDLKPENLFVAGNPNEYPGFLNNVAKFSIGLIDVETAVVIDAEDPVLIPQPQLAGTPLYATPTHLMANSILMEVYDDLAVILNLQDWYATLAMLFKLITGEALFGTTAHVFPEILNQMRLLDPAGPDLKEEIARIQGLFWSSALAEFESGMAHHATGLARVEVTVPEGLVGEIRNGLNTEIKEIEQIVAKSVADQSFFTSGDKRRFLKTASAEKIRQMKSKLSQEIESGASHSQGQVLLYFEILEELKARLEYKQRAVDTISAPKPVIAAGQLLEVMFQRVYTTMYPATWPSLTPRLYGSSAFLATDITTYQATM